MRITAALTGLLLVLTAVPVAAGDDVETTQGETLPRFTETVTEAHRVETDHGVIYGEIIRPDPDVYPDLYADGQGTSGAGVPVIATYSPYNVLTSPTNHTGSIAADGVADYFVPRGYARARFDVVGTRESSGCYDYGGIRERETGAAVVDYLGSQDWSNGEVGMIGGSYDGTTQLAAAIEQPEHLTAIIPQVAIDRWYDYAYGGGIRYFLNSERPTDEGFDTPLAFDFGFGLAPPSDPSQPHFADAVVDRVRPCDALAHTQRAYDPDPVYDDFWDERDYRARADQVEAAVLIEGGWLDHNVKHWDSTRFFQALPDTVDDGDPDSDDPAFPKKLVMGQWAHSASQFADAQDIRHAWFDHWLLGIDTGVMDLPPVDTQTNDGVRHQEQAWPPAGTEQVPLTLSDGGPGTPPGSLVLQGASATWSDHNPALSEEQIFDRGCPLGACVLLATAPVDGGLRISGSPRLEATLITDATETHLTPVLFDEAPDGSREVITRGFLNARNHDGLDASEALTPGEPYDVAVELWDVDWQLADGHSLGLVLMSTNVAWAVHDTSAATTAIELGPGHSGASLVLPLSDGAGNLRTTPSADQHGRALDGFHR